MSESTKDFGYWVWLEIFENNGTEMEAQTVAAGPCSRTEAEEEASDLRFLWGPFDSKEAAERRAQEVEDVGYLGTA
jgi:hypothetical protein